ncbi:MAG: hypothetical protein KIT68_04695 [Phycisphaeraceae bacterium]|nr:hypothetical protein [Phycisphaeraceae bacterium]
MNLNRHGFKSLVLALVAGMTVMFSAAQALADRVVLNDGTVLEGTVERDEGGIVILVLKNGERKFLTKGEIKSITKDEPSKPVEAPKAEPKPEAPKADEPKPAAPAETPATKPADKKDGPAARALTGRPTRVAVLNFGAPSDWQGKIDDTVGIQISAAAWADAVPMLEKDKVDVVVVRINSGGGLLLEMDRFHKVFENQYKKKFRTVAWVESAISCAAMSPWVIEEFYMMPEGNIGACTGWSGNLVAMKGIELEEVLVMMENASRLGKHDYRIMRAMQILEPLSANVDEDGNVTWFQDLSGKHVLNDGKTILTFNAKDAVRFKFAKGIAATKEDLVKVMGLNEVEWAGKEASDFLDRNMRESDRTQKRITELQTKYQLALNAARQLQDRQLRGQEIGKARQALNEMKRWINVNPNFALMTGMTPEWFSQQEEILKELMRR